MCASDVLVEGVARTVRLYDSDVGSKFKRGPTIALKDQLSTLMANALDDDHRDFEVSFYLHVPLCIIYMALMS